MREVDLSLAPGALMLKPRSAIYNPSVCGPLDVPGGPNARGSLTLRLKAGTTLAEARTIASTPQTRVKDLCPLAASGSADRL